MDFDKDEIVDIKESQYGFFGGPGKMLLPSRQSVESVLQKVPPGKLLTTDLLRQKLADIFNVRGTCPVTTRKVLQAISTDSHCSTAYWRVVNQNGDLIANNADGVEAQSARLLQDGVPVEQGAKKPKVRDFKARIVDLG